MLRNTLACTARIGLQHFFESSPRDLQQGAGAHRLYRRLAFLIGEDSEFAHRRDRTQCGNLGTVLRFDGQLARQQDEHLRRLRTGGADHRPRFKLLPIADPQYSIDL